VRGHPRGRHGEMSKPNIITTSAAQKSFWGKFTEALNLTNPKPALRRKPRTAAMGAKSMLGTIVHFSPNGDYLRSQLLYESPQLNALPGSLTNGRGHVAEYHYEDGRSLSGPYEPDEQCPLCELTFGPGLDPDVLLIVAAAMFLSEIFGESSANLEAVFTPSFRAIVKAMIHERDFGIVHPATRDVIRCAAKYKLIQPPKPGYPNQWERIGGKP
jgi:hypothetical protein